MGIFVSDILNIWSFSTKIVGNKEPTVLVENYQMLREKMSKTVNNDFVKLGIYNWMEDSKLTEQINFDNHPSIHFIMNKYQKSFNLNLSLFSQIKCEAQVEIAAKIIKIAQEEIIVPTTNMCISSTFLDELKIADIVSLY